MSNPTANLIASQTPTASGTPKAVTVNLDRIITLIETTYIVACVKAAKHFWPMGSAQDIADYCINAEKTETHDAKEAIRHE